MQVSGLGELAGGAGGRRPLAAVPARGDARPARQDRAARRRSPSPRATWTTSTTPSRPAPRPKPRTPAADRVGRMPERLILRNFQSAGDILMLTATVRDLHRCYPGRFVTDVRSSCSDLWIGNPWLTPLRDDEPGVRVVECQYPIIHKSNQAPWHFLFGFSEHLNDVLGLRIQPTEYRGDVHLTPEEREWFARVQEARGEARPYWLFASGGKWDYTIKWWDAARYQQVVDHFRGRIDFVQVGETHHHHPDVRGATDLRGRTTLRQLVRLMYHAQGAISAVSLLMHLAAAVEVKPGMPKNRPCVVIAGGREPPHFTAYPQHQFIHTVGALRLLRRRRLLEVAHAASRGRRPQGRTRGAVRRRGGPAAALHGHDRSRRGDPPRRDLLPRRRALVPATREPGRAVPRRALGEPLRVRTRQSPQSPQSHDGAGERLCKCGAHHAPAATDGPESGISPGGPRRRQWLTTTFVTTTRRSPRGASSWSCSPAARHWPAWGCSRRAAGTAPPGRPRLPRRRAPARRAPARRAAARARPRARLPAHRARPAPLVAVAARRAPRARRP